jgi:hypothetical protein
MVDRERSSIWSATKGLAPQLVDDGSEAALIWMAVSRRPFSKYLEPSLADAVVKYLSRGLGK